MLRAEAGEGFRRRVVAAREHFGLGEAPFALITAVPNLFDRGDTGKLISAIKEQTRAAAWSPGMIILDTLARVATGADGNSSRDMYRAFPA